MLIVLLTALVAPQHRVHTEFPGSSLQIYLLGMLHSASVEHSILRKHPISYRPLAHPRPDIDLVYTSIGRLLYHLTHPSNLLCTVQ